MTCTKLLLDSIKDGYSKDFVLLLEDWGRWSHFLGCSGFKGGHSTAPSFIDDDTALIIDQAMCNLKQRKPRLYQLISMYYIAGLDELDIVHVLNQETQITKARKTWQKQSREIGKNTYGVIRTRHHLKFSVDTADVIDLIEFASKLVLKLLQEKATKD